MSGLDTLITMNSTFIMLLSDEMISWTDIYIISIRILFHEQEKQREAFNQESSICFCCFLLYLLAAK